MWWKPNHRGYTRTVAEAGRYSAEEALEILTNANIGVLHETAVAEKDASDKAWPAAKPGFATV